MFGRHVEIINGFRAQWTADNEQVKVFDDGVLRGVVEKFSESVHVDIYNPSNYGEHIAYVAPELMAKSGAEIARYVVGRLV
jgi:uncharacterized alkaline shock family protein YloU